jgi:hypothetical protein
MLTSLLFRENKATSAPEIVKDNNNKPMSIMTRKVVPCGVPARKKK